MKMPMESRDRLVRPVDIAAVFARRRSDILGILSDETDIGSPYLFGSPVGRGITVNAATPRRLIGAIAAGVGGGGGGSGRGNLGTPRATVGRGWNQYATPVTGRENRPINAGITRRGRGRATSSVLPSWYPRTPLRDITSVVRAIERRRARLGETNGQEFESPIPHDIRLLNSNVPLPGAQLEHNISMISPNPTSSPKLSPHSVVKVLKVSASVGKVPKILLNITNRASAESELLTPQKKLLNSIDTVEKQVMEELRKLKRTPSAKKAEREKRVRTLMSMR
ncbi:hypothetical protein CFOL_v3_07441 [Cephalotus follicularis]|uniref:Uncharacterized protein n=1 Tax=Cephalotus follicularis TaxID=3775 RepID=A0A1Q3B837_CEPFO|nr:hypothetical protein CFOL_v3_07441 [Cephalotus follicularis]